MCIYAYVCSISQYKCILEYDHNNDRMQHLRFFDSGARKKKEVLMTAWKYLLEKSQRMHF